MKSRVRKNDGSARSRFLRERYWELYLFLVPALLILVIFRYIPMGGILMAFQDFNLFDGILKSPFNHFENFRRIFTDSYFFQVLWNTLIIKIYKQCFWIPLPLIVAVLLNEVGSKVFRRSVQTVIYMPHFLSWVVVGGLFFNLLSVNGGIVNQFIRLLGGEPVAFMMRDDLFRGILVFSSMWKEVGWGTIVYLGAFATIDPQLYEAARIDGASRLQQVIHITLPSVSTIMVLMLLMSLSQLLDAGFEQILIMYNPSVYGVADVIATYVYRYGIGRMEYGYATAVGLFNSLVSFVLVMSTNALSRRFLDRTIW